VTGSVQAGEAGKPTASKPSTMSEEEHQAHHSGMAGALQPSFVSVVHIQHGHIMRRVPVRAITHHTAVSPDGKFAIAVHAGAGGISIIDLGKMAVVKTLQIGARPNFAEFTRDGKRLYISNAGAGTVSEINATDWSVLREIRVGKEPEHLALTTDGATLYVVNVGDGTVSVVELANGKTVRTFRTGKEPHGIVLSSDGRWLFVSSLGDGTLSLINLAGGEIKTVDLKPAPYHVAYADDLNKLYVSSRMVPKIWVIDPHELKVREEIDIGRGVAHQMVIRHESDTQ